MIDSPMVRAIANAAMVNLSARPNPGVGAVVVTADGTCFDGATQPVGGPHAEVVAINAAGAHARGASLYVTLEPCSHHGRTPPCIDAIIAAGIRRVEIAVNDPDPRVSGRGAASLADAGIEVSVGAGANEVRAQLRAYLHQRSTGRPFVVMKLATTLDGRIAAADGTSQWITGPEARADAHRLRSESDAIIVGAGTVRADDPALTVRHVEGKDPLRVVLGRAPADARIQPCVEVSGELDPILCDLAQRGVVQVLVEGGATVAHQFHRQGLVDQYVIYLAPVLHGGDDGAPLMRGAGAPTLADMWRGRIMSTALLGADLRVVMEPIR